MLIEPAPSVVGGFAPISLLAVAQMPPERHKLRLVEIKLTIDQAALCHGKLRKILKRPTRMTPAKYRPDVCISDPRHILDVLDKRLSELPGTTPISEPKPGVTVFLRHDFTLKVRPNEAAYLLRIVKNSKLDKWRKDKRRSEQFSPLEAAEIAEEEGGRASFFGPSHPENPTANLPQAVMRKALGELPKLLRMSAQEVDALLAALYAAEGNVSETARQLGQPQRKTARQIERIQKHLKRRGLAA